MEAMLVALIAGGAISAAVHLIRSARKRAKEEPASPELLEAPSVERGLEDLRAGDVLVYQRRDLIVQEVRCCQDGDRGWWECQLDEEGQEAWLIVDRDDQSGAILGGPAAEQPILDEPPRSLDHEGRVYRLSRCGQARVSTEDEQQEAGYWDYRDVGSARFWIRRSADGPWRCYAGERTERHLIDVITAS